MNKQQLANKIWASANNMRNKIDANEYKDYILDLIFYKFLSTDFVNELYAIRQNPTEKEFEVLIGSSEIILYFTKG